MLVTNMRMSCGALSRIERISEEEMSLRMEKEVECWQCVKAVFAEEFEAEGKRGMCLKGNRNWAGMSKRVLIIWEISLEEIRIVWGNRHGNDSKKRMCVSQGAGRMPEE